MAQFQGSIARKLLLIVIVFLVACQQDAVKRPTPFLEHNEMVALMTDLQLADAYISDLKANGTDVKELTTKVHDSVFRIHNLPRLAFEENLAWYSANIKDLNKVYEDVLINLEQLKSPDLKDSTAKARK
jgi:hypothetical protein